MPLYISPGGNFIPYSEAKRSLIPKNDEATASSSNPGTLTHSDGLVEAIAAKLEGFITQAINRAMDERGIPTVAHIPPPADPTATEDRPQHLPPSATAVAKNKLKNSQNENLVRGGPLTKGTLMPITPITPINRKNRILS